MASLDFKPELTCAFELYPGIQSALDEAALNLLQRADPARAVEIIEDIAARGDVRNPSAFVAKALHRYPQRRGEAPLPLVASEMGGGGSSTPLSLAATGPVEEALSLHPAVRSALDEGAIRRLRGADPERAVEVIEEIAAKTDVNNPSAFVVKALMSYPHKRGHPGDVENVLEQHPSLQATLDEAAILKLKGADPARAVEIIEEVLAKGDVQNTSAFVVKALSAYPHKRGSPKSVVQLLARHPELRDALDEAAAAKLSEADPARAVEIIEDIVAKGDVRNPSAFVAKALQLYPHKRGGASDAPSVRSSPAIPLVASVVNLPSIGGTRFGGMVDRELARHPGVLRGLDAEALRMLAQAEPDRAIEIVRDLAGKQDVRNPSAFVTQALKSFPQRRGDPQDVDSALARRPRVRAALDEAALQRLQEADPARAVEVIEDVAAKKDVHNPSAFVVKALLAHPQKRGREEYSGIVQPLAKQPRPAPGGARPSRVGADCSSPLTLVSGLDEQAQRMLTVANPARAEEILEELAEKGGQVRNASAFVARALHQFPYPRGRRIG